jgi:predicted transglutaminase-like cysteine proteinase
MPSLSLALAPCPPALRRRASARVSVSRQWLYWLSAIALAWLAAAPASLRARDAERLHTAAKQLGPQAVAGLRALEALLDTASEFDDAGKLSAVNQFFNRRIRFRDDIEVWGELDYWASPLELLAKGEGDCEDFAIAKYFSLLRLGVPSAQLRLVYVRARIDGAPARQQAHMVLAHYASPASEPLILDNLVSAVLPAAQRPDLTPVFSFNSDGLWQGMGALTAGDPTARLSLWRNVLAKARAEGFP